MKIKNSTSYCSLMAVVLLLLSMTVGTGYSQGFPEEKPMIKCSFPARQDNAGAPSAPAVAGDGKYSVRWTNNTTMSNSVFLHRYNQSGNFLGSNIMYRSSRLESAGMVGLTFNAAAEQEGTFCKFVIQGKPLQGPTINGTSLVFRINPPSSFTGQQLSDSYWPLVTGGSKVITVGWTNFQSDDTYVVQLFDLAREGYITLPGTGGGLFASSGQFNVVIPGSALMAANVAEGPYQFSLYCPRKRTRQVFGFVDVAKSSFRLMQVGEIPAMPRTEEPFNPFYVMRLVLDARMATNPIVVKEIRTKTRITGLSLVGAGLTDENQVIIANTTLQNQIGTNLVQFSQLNRVIQPGTFQVWNLECIAAGTSFWGTMQWFLVDDDGVTVTTLDGSPVTSSYTPSGLAAQGALITIGPGGNGLRAVSPLHVRTWLRPGGIALGATGEPLRWYELMSVNNIGGRWNPIQRVRADPLGFIECSMPLSSAVGFFRLREVE